MVPYLWLVLGLDSWALCLLGFTEWVVRRQRTADARKRLVLERLMRRPEDWNSAA